ncbi:DsbA family protein [Candidatus Saccharibacteria bacterium]|nr:DsbA family protein [Candidatus Saccharibacteria bacterium]
MPKSKKNASWKTAVSPGGAAGRGHRTQSIVMIATIATLGVVIAILVIALVIMAGDARQDKLTDNEVNTESNEDIPLARATAINASGLDGSKLITAADLAEGEIPDHYIGNEDSAVVVIAYEDFACSHCQALAADAEQIYVDYGDRVLFIHRSFNLGFPNSEKTLQSAEAAYLVGGQDAYWAMTKLLYQDDKFTGRMKIGQAVFNGYAKQIGLDSTKFQAASAEAVIANKLGRDRELGIEAGVNGTPSWFINGQQITPRDAEIRTALDAALSL